MVYGIPLLSNPYTILIVFGLMSQNREADKDRLGAEHDYEVNLKAELEIMALHEKVDLLREKQWAELISIQQDQLRLLNQLSENKIQGKTNEPRPDKNYPDGHEFGYPDDLGL
jgi:uncharacterized membrane protein